MRLVSLTVDENGFTQFPDDVGFFSNSFVDDAGTLVAEYSGAIDAGTLPTYVGAGFLERVSYEVRFTSNQFKGMVGAAAFTAITDAIADANNTGASWDALRAFVGRLRDRNVYISADTPEYPAAVDLLHTLLPGTIDADQAALLKLGLPSNLDIPLS